LTYFATWAEGQQQARDCLLEEADPILRALAWGAGAGRWAEVLRLGRAVEGALALGGRWSAWAQVQRWALQAAQALGERAAEAWALHQLGTRTLCLGDAAAARTSLDKALHIRQAIGDRAGAAVTRHNLTVLLGPPAPPQEPPQPPAMPAAAGPAAAGVPLLVKGAIALASVLLLALSGLGIQHFWPRPTPTPAPTAVPTSTPAPTATLTGTPTPTATPSSTPTPTPTPTSTPTPTPTPTSTPTPVPPTPTPTSTPTPVTPTPTPTSTPTPVPPTPTPTSTPTLVPPTPTPMPPTPTPTITPSPTSTPDTIGPAISDITESDDPIYFPPGCDPEQVTIRASVFDPAGVSGVKLTYRVVDSARGLEGDWVVLPMDQVTMEIYGATVGDEQLRASLDPPSYGAPVVLVYYVQAYDGKGNDSSSPSDTVTVEYCPS